MKTLTDYFTDARAGGWAIGHFNFATADVLRAIVRGAKDGGAPCVMVGTSPGETEFIGMAQSVALVRAACEEFGFPVFLNADHFASVSACTTAIDVGYDTVLFDGSRTSYDGNVAQTKAVAEYARHTRPGVMVEGELGYLRGISTVQESVVVMPTDYTSPEQAADFVRRTGVQRLAVVFGNIHGIVTEQEEVLDIAHLSRVAGAVPDVYLVLHGASGLPDEQITVAIDSGIRNVHFNTELRVAYAQGLKDELAREPEQTTPYKLLALADAKVRELVEQKVRLFMRAK